MTTAEKPRRQPLGVERKKNPSLGGARGSGSLAKSSNCPTFSSFQSGYCRQKFGLFSVSTSGRGKHV
jgi:hypothetical protein